MEALEQRARLDPNRLPRGRTYARTGAVEELEVRAGEVVAAVQGSRAEPYRVTVRVRTYSDKEWDRTLGTLASQAGHLASLLDGEMPPGVADDLAAAKIDLLPVAGEVQPRCSCPDWAEPCKHSAAVCYLVADTLDADPFLLFLMRGRDRDSLLAGLRAKRAASAGVAASGRAPYATEGGAADGAGASQATSWATDAGLNAQQAWARWASLSGGGSPPMPVIPLPRARPGRPTVLAVDPPAGLGITSASLQSLASDAAQRAWEMAHGERSTGLELSAAQDLARRAAAMIGPSGGRREILELASAAGITARDLMHHALAWRDGGSEGLFVLLEQWEAPPEVMAKGRALLGQGATVRRNRVTLGARQLRLGRDGRWYPFRRSGRGTGAWAPDGPPTEADEPAAR
ncbi:MAG: SWIM zinc finger family protein [Actinomycetota bacterium]|nr:SWIM zinc finger family protein [Actinomycetota bacterium]